MAVRFVLPDEPPPADSGLMSPLATVGNVGCDPTVGLLAPPAYPAPALEVHNATAALAPSRPAPASYGRDLPIGRSRQTFRLARSWGSRLTPIAQWAREVVRRSGLPTDAAGDGHELDGLGLASLQQRTQDAFVPPVYRITLAEPLLAFRFYGDLCVQLTELYTSLATVLQVPCWGAITRALLGLTGRNGADHLVAVRLAPGSVIAAGGISNRAVWADQILVEAGAGVAVVACISQAELTC